MKVKYEDSVEYKVLSIIKSSKNTTFIRDDFEALGSYRQISRALNKLIKKGDIVKIGQGIYAKAYHSEYIEEPVIVGGFDKAAREALDRLSVSWEPGEAERAYNAGETQQVPTNNIVHLKTRLRRKISYLNRELYFEGQVNAK